jgi:hypothetical protein
MVGSIFYRESRMTKFYPPYLIPSNYKSFTSA